MKKYREVFTINPDEWQPYQIKPFYSKDAVRITEGTNNLREMLREVAGVGPLQGYDFETAREFLEVAEKLSLSIARLVNHREFYRCYQEEKLVGYLVQDDRILRLFISTEIKLGE